MNVILVLFQCFEDKLIFKGYLDEAYLISFLWIYQLLINIWNDPIITKIYFWAPRYCHQGCFQFSLVCTLEERGSASSFFEPMSRDAIVDIWEVSYWLISSSRDTNNETSRSYSSFAPPAMLSEMYISKHYQLEKTLIFWQIIIYSF